MELSAEAEGLMSAAPVELSAGAPVQDFEGVEEEEGGGEGGEEEEEVGDDGGEAGSGIDMAFELCVRVCVVEYVLLQLYILCVCVCVTATIQARIGVVVYVLLLLYIVCVCVCCVHTRVTNANTGTGKKYSCHSHLHYENTRYIG